MSENFLNLESVSVLLNDARKRITEAENRSKEAIEASEKRTTKKLDEIADEVKKLKDEFSKWSPLLNKLNSADNTKKSLTIVLLSSFITNIVTIIVTIFIVFIKNGLVQ